MPIYSYKKVADVGSDYYPLNTHLCVEYSSKRLFCTLSEDFNDLQA